LTERDKSKAADILKKHKIAWPNAFDPDGWNGVMRRFNLSGYGLTLVDKEGIVRGIHVHARDVERLLKEDPRR